jgi:bacterioferritin-associated ferredoxin
MIICSCNVISDYDITQAVIKLKKNNPQQIITPEHIFKVLGHQPDCGTCIASINKIISG